MKKLAGLLAIFMLIAIGCSNPESTLTGRWKSTEVKGFEAEFKADHTGATYTPIAGHAGAAKSTQTPFQWAVSKDGSVKITEGKTVYLGKLVAKKLELGVNGAKTVLVKTK